MPWKFRIFYDNGKIEESDAQYETQDEAERECLNYREGYQANRDIQSMEHDVMDDVDIEDYEVYEL